MSKLNQAYDVISSNLINIHERWIDMPNREMWIHSVDVAGPGYDGDEPGIEYIMAVKIIKNLHTLRHQSKKDPVIIHLQNCGGAEDAGMAIYDTIMAMPYKVIMVAYASAASMASIVLQSADVRLMLPNTNFMFHMGMVAVGGENKTVYSDIEYFKRTDEIMIDIYVNSVKGSPKFKDKSESEVRKEIKHCMDKKGNVYLTAQESVRWGFADGILKTWDELDKYAKATK